MQKPDRTRLTAENLTFFSFKSFSWSQGQLFFSIPSSHQSIQTSFRPPAGLGAREVNVSILASIDLRSVHRAEETEQSLAEV